MVADSYSTAFLEWWKPYWVSTPDMSPSANAKAAAWAAWQEAMRNSGPRDEIIEECAVIADKEWVGANSLVHSKAAGRIAKAIRALKGSSATGEKV